MTPDKLPLIAAGFVAGSLATIAIFFAILW